MSREQMAIADFSVFLMRWIAESNNNDVISNAIWKAITTYSDERKLPHLSLSEFQFSSDKHACAFEAFSKDEFFRLCVSLTKLLKNHTRMSQQAITLINRVLILQDEYKHSMKLIADDTTSVRPEDCELWRRIEFSKEDVQLLLYQLPDSSELMAKIPACFFHAEEDGWKFYLRRAKEIAEQVGTLAAKTTTAACTTAINFTTTNSAAFFPHSSSDIPNSREFLLSIDKREGAWETLGDGLSGRASLKTRIIHEVCDTYFRSKQSDTEFPLSEQGEDDFLNMTSEVAALPDRLTASQPLHSFSTTNQAEVKALQSYATKMIATLEKPGHALQVYQSLLAIHSAMKIMQLPLSAASVAQKKTEVQMGASESPNKVPGAPAAVSPAEPITRPVQVAPDTDDDTVQFDDTAQFNDNRRSSANFAHVVCRANVTQFP